MTVSDCSDYSSHLKGICSCFSKLSLKSSSVEKLFWLGLKKAVKPPNLNYFRVLGVNHSSMGATYETLWMTKDSF